MAIVENWLPPSRDNWELVVYLFQFFPLVTVFQWVQPWYGAGKTSGESRLNIPGKIAWITMEVPGFTTVLYIVATLPAEAGIAQLPWQNKVMAGLFTLHYIYRAIIAPIIAPSMSPIHVLVWASAVVFQITNGISIGGWLGGYGPTAEADWQSKLLDGTSSGRVELGFLIFFLGLAANIYHDDELREIRRRALQNQQQRVREEAENPAQDKKGRETQGSRKGVHKVYEIPENGLFRWVFFPHYLCEWIEWGGFWMMGGIGCVPARNFVLNEIATMLPRAIQGRRWYLERFGEEKVGGRKAIIPGFL